MNTRLLLSATAVSLSLGTSLAVAASPAAGITATSERYSPAPATVTHDVASTAAVAVKDFDVFVDVPTGFAFVKTPGKWTFVRKLDAAQLKNLPPSTLTSLAVNASDGGHVGVRVAQGLEEGGPTL